MPNNKDLDVAIKDEIDTKSISENPMPIPEKDVDLQAERDLMAELLKVCKHSRQFLYLAQEFSGDGNSEYA